ncbi:S-adenosyl-L-methionine-dependent methyltransferase [Irpex rosettiformis]|uniref:S-adenosyl-L-methionine-dependent methyltransferase n=1 Tax=Irpex rosettiformis TaxID=378272 RepID=A0ACB8U7L2_9APHY|nr:S-adenosyl-L-methionine-dependent methyltransferase [Irpex rosettiformis]
MSQEVSQLLSLITSSVKAIEDEFAASGVSAIPSLNSTDTHPLDLKPLKPVRDQLRILEGACAQLCATLAPPVCTVTDRVSNAIFDRTCLEVVVSCKIADLLKDKPDGMHIDQLGKAAGIEPGKSEQIMRYLATSHIFAEVKEGVFSNNRLSIQLLEETPTYAYVQFRVDQTNRAACTLLETLLDPVRGPSYEGKDAAICKAYNWPEGWFDWHAQTEEGRKEAELFGRVMTAFDYAVAVQAVVTDYPWRDLAPGSTICDIGSGHGTVAVEIAKAHPGLKLILQDMPTLLKYAEESFWPKECPCALQEQKVEFIPIDFFTEAPAAGCDIYFLKGILHDWSDELCVKILKNIRKVMRPNSKVLINEHLLLPATALPTPLSSPNSAPAPLLSNTGAGRLRLYSLDVSLLTLLNSRERFLQEFVTIAQQASLKFKSTWDAGDTYILEFVVA